MTRRGCASSGNDKYTTMSNYDSANDTLEHIGRVRELLVEASQEIVRRADVHDASKLLPPEKDGFDEYTPKLKDCVYGSDEYRSFLEGLKPALDHHYAHNSHHPQYYPWHCPACNIQLSNEAKEHAPSLNGKSYCPQCSGMSIIYETELMEKPDLGINGMDLFDVIEMFFDWKAATERMASGDIGKSIEINRTRFNMSPQLARIFRNTTIQYGWMKP